MGAKIHTTRMRDSFLHFRMKWTIFAAILTICQRINAKDCACVLSRDQILNNDAGFVGTALQGECFPILGHSNVTWQHIQYHDQVYCECSLVRTFIKVKQINIVQSPKRFKSNNIFWRFSRCPNEVLKSKRMNPVTPLQGRYKWTSQYDPQYMYICIDNQSWPLTRKRLESKIQIDDVTLKYTYFQKLYVIWSTKMFLISICQNLIDRQWK